MKFSETYLKHLSEIKAPEDSKRPEYEQLNHYAEDLLENPDNEEAKNNLSELLTKLAIEW
jgi:hypothetical protein